MSTLFTFVPAFGHDFTGHPEHAGRGKAVMDLLKLRGVLGDITQLEPRAATSQQILRAHSSSVFERVQQTSLRGGGHIDADTYVTDQSFDLAVLAAGTVTDAAVEIEKGEHKNGYAFVRTPGHHAEFDRSMGFCLFNNIAVAAKEVQASTECKRIMIVDIDVHHGNGTQDIFYGDESVLFISTHQFGAWFYPGTGSAGEVGQADAERRNLNIPLIAGIGDQGYLAVTEQLIGPAARQFKPDMILVSAGFDAHWQDPLAAMELSLTGYAQISQSLIELSNELCDGRILFVQEGGYMLDVLAHAVLNSIYALSGRDQIIDPFGLAPTNSAPSLDKLIEELQILHLLK